jgi:hypothetical protein
MVDQEKGALHTTDGGGSGKHPAPKAFDFLVGPTTTDQFNTARLRLIPIACWRVDDARFGFDSSFVTSDLVDDKKDIRAELRLLVNLLKEHPESPLSVFGHADPVGTDDYNKQLSGRRATVIYALLISSTDPDAAVKLWQAVSSEEKWGARQRHTMQSFTGLPAGTPDSGLIKAYMQKLCPPDLKVGKQDFLAQGADPKGKGDFQGCSEFNPVLIFSRKRNSDFDKAKDETARNDANAPNRRVLGLLFQKGTKIDPAKWPCPRATEGVGGCKKRFWSDGEKRRSMRLADKDRNFEDKRDTFACRFYDRLLTNSPCESLSTIVKIRLFDPQARPLPFAPCLITEQGQEPRPDRATGDAPSPLGTTPGSPPGSSAGGNKDDAIITFRVTKLPATVNVKWSRPKALDSAKPPPPPQVFTDQDDEKNPVNAYKYEFNMNVTIDIPEADPQAASRTRMENLGYDVNPPVPVPGLGDPISAFQRDYKPQFGDIVENGTLNQPTIDAIKATHENCDPVLKAGSDIAVKR